MRVEATAEFKSWYDNLRVKEQAQIDTRLYRIKQHGHFGDVKDLGNGLAELRWINGRRIYFTRVSNDDGDAVLLILGGQKNAQKKDIRQARLHIQKYSRS